METKKLTRLIIIALGAWILIVVLCGMRVHAAESSDSSTDNTGVIKQLDADASALEDAKADSPVVMELKSGDYIFVTGETDGWYQIYYHGDRMYVDSTVPMTDIDHSAEIAAELAGQQVTDAAWIDEYQMQVRAIKTARTWRIVIAILVVAFIAVTVVSTLKNKKNAKEVQA